MTVMTALGWGMTKRVQVAEAKAKFSAIIDEVQHGNEHVIIERRGRPVAAIVRIEELEQIEATHPTGQHLMGALALVGALSDIDDAVIDEFVKDVYAAREKDLGRPVSLEP